MSKDNLPSIFADESPKSDNESLKPAESAVSSVRSEISHIDAVCDELDKRNSVPLIADAAEERSHEDDDYPLDDRPDYGASQAVLDLIQKRESIGNRNRFKRRLSGIISKILSPIIEKAEKNGIKKDQTMAVISILLELGGSNTSIEDLVYEEISKASQDLNTDDVRAIFNVPIQQWTDERLLFQVGVYFKRELADMMN